MDTSILQRIFQISETISSTSSFYGKIYSEEEIKTLTQKVITALLLSDPRESEPSYLDIGGFRTDNYTLDRDEKKLTIVQVVNEFPNLEGPTIGVKAFALSGLRRKKTRANAATSSVITDFNPVTIQTEITNDDASIRGTYEDYITSLVRRGEDNIDAFLLVKGSNISLKERFERQKIVGEIVIGMYNNMAESAYNKIDISHVNRMSNSEYQAYINNLVRNIRLASMSSARSLEERASEVKVPYDNIPYQR